MVRGLVVEMVEWKLTLVMKGDLCHRFFDSRWWCTSTPDTDQELDQVSLRVSLGTLFAYAFTVSSFVKLLQFTVLCAASHVPDPYNPLTTSP